MSFNINLNSDGEKAVIELSGRFQFGSHRDFRRVCDEALKLENKKEIEVNMKDVEYLDSSALGMLLLLRERAMGQDRKVVLKECSVAAKQALDVAKFDLIFTIL